MDHKQKEEFNLQIRKLLKEFGVKSHQAIQKKFTMDASDSKITLKLEIDGKISEEVHSIIKIK